jgi:hypothetical protein
MALYRFIGTWLVGERSGLIRRMMPPMDFLDDTVSIRGPDERPRISVVLDQVATDHRLQVDERGERNFPLEPGH